MVVFRGCQEEIGLNHMAVVVNLYMIYDRCLKCAKVQVGGDHRLFACLVCHFHRGQNPHRNGDLVGFTSLRAFFWMKDFCKQIPQKAGCSQLS